MSERVNETPLTSSLQLEFLEEASGLTGFSCTILAEGLSTGKLKRRQYSSSVVNRKVVSWR